MKKLTEFLYITHGHSEEKARGAARAFVIFTRGKEPDYGLWDDR
ncbi:MAG: hypothetical protein RML93_00215 [Anaerolineales bacterium]|nr:hypothetical protein [Anaerolineales bacterium]MCS7248700.1 hypothetical protein [Anaerolineales bacterium]MDW8162513.1 hypothetical protein [Anaerolineales bacterium]MDW8445694.1 hypothetical protein [Anaerolineales bacterium]